MSWKWERDYVVDRFGWLFSLLVVVGAVGALRGGQTLIDAPMFDLASYPKSALTDDVESTLNLFAVRCRWLGSVILFAGAVVAAFAFSCVNIVRTFTLRELWRTGVIVCTVVAVSCFVANAAIEMRCIQGEPSVQGFVSRLLSSLDGLKEPNRCGVHHEVMMTRFFGEGAGLVLSFSLMSLAAFGRTITSRELAARFQALRTGLYVGSFLFVAGVIMSQANFTWIFALWGSQSEEIAAAQSSVVTAGLVQAGAAYSALLLATVAPTRWLLDWKLARATTSDERAAWRESHGVAVTWRDELRQNSALFLPRCFRYRCSMR